ncbi:HD domain-containing protein [Rubrobacter taiwanensis]|jgi:uncharacterized protein|uniref:HD domain-containing protein n=1 Tax=Rubrobacter taiwanensis TaxID=185139 RepID=A0A4R1BSP3_9ACTN|nr:HD domain-containing protein [Rubrobacter taiwanensis]TCJ20658.1 HD domain-containing protein [Rubrobacter taiwanensis]
MVVSDIESLVARAGTDPVWGYAHCLRVHEMARTLARLERLSYDEEILRLACLLHDIGLYKAYNMKEGADHVVRSGRVAERLLKERNFPPRATRTVLDAIKHHPPDAGVGRSVESVLLKDAVGLDYLGAVGVSRVMAMVGSEAEVPDLPAAVRHIRALGTRIPPLLRLGSSRRIARERVAEAESFLQALGRETAGLQLL